MIAYKSFSLGLLSVSNRGLGLGRKINQHATSSESLPPVQGGSAAGGQSLIHYVSTKERLFLSAHKEFLTRRPFLSIEFFLDRSGGPVDLGK
jgi:hypothetical protein